MKTIKNSILSIATAAVCLTSLTGCMDETMPTTVATDEMVAQSATATEALAKGMPAKMISVWDDTNHCYFGYPAEMIFRDMLTGDAYHVGETGYSHFITWSRNQYMGDGYLKTQFHWNYYYGCILAANGVIGAVNEDSATPDQLGYKGTAYAYRALLYLDMARMYEFLPNDIYSDGKNNEGATVLNLTVPIVTDQTTDTDARSNPRATREDMLKFILSDLDNAEKLIVNQEGTLGNTMPDLACVYGLKARAYMWVEDYVNAEKYARLAIDNSKVKPMTAEKGLNTKTGFNTASDFMWAAQLTSESEAVQTGIINWASWTSNQSSFGYTGASTALYYVMDKRMYERIGDNDWRKLLFKAPAGSALDGKNPFLDNNDGAAMADYSAIKFRPNAGNMDDYAVGASGAVPVMRVEEMYFIEAEAVAHQNASRGYDLLKDFMVKYRDASYDKTIDNQALIIDEIVFQKRVELWGEGQTFFDIKRLNMSVTRGYEGTNCQDASSRLNTNGRPAWMNIVMVKTEGNNNDKVEGMNNPDPSGKYTPWTSENE